ncbi:MAG: FIST C-terminal domain-containing protein [Synergistaceae bacterium]|jgi:hypothetical protein|nr:FIST C-terminal domain-containing protein [Synergistaceae bacterium]
MIKALAAHTSEIDDAELAVADIMEQLDLEPNLLKNSVGIITCYLDFIDNGTVKAICALLPFDVVGINTLGCATASLGGGTTLALFVLTSDDVSFSAGVSLPVLPEGGKAISELYEKTSAGLGGKPNFGLVFAPFILGTAGDIFVRRLDELSGGVPLFGCTPSDFTIGHRSPQVIYNGETYQGSMAIVLMSGNLNPRFFLSGVSEKKISNRKAVVTASEDNILKEINGTPAAEFLDSLGLLLNDGSIAGAMGLVHLVMNFPDGTPPVIRVIQELTPEGYLKMGGLVPVNSTLAVAALDYDDVIKSLSDVMKEARRDPCDLLFIISCMARNFALGLDDMDEINLVRATIKDGTPFLFTYTSGEFSPVQRHDGTTATRHHNVTLVACAL